MISGSRFEYDSPVVAARKVARQYENGNHIIDTADGGVQVWE
jgi:hypothetical protein